MGDMNLAQRIGIIWTPINEIAGFDDSDEFVFTHDRYGFPLHRKIIHAPKSALEGLYTTGRGPRIQASHFARANLP